MNSWKYCIFILLLYKSDKISNVLCKSPDGDQKPTRGGNNKKISENKQSGTPTKLDSITAATKTAQEKQRLKGAYNNSEPTKAATTGQLPQKSGTKGPVLQKGRKAKASDALYDLMDVDLENIDPNSFFITHALNEPNGYKMAPIMYKTIKSIRLGGKIIWIKNEHSVCYSFKVFNIGGNSALLVLETLDTMHDPNFISIALNNISSDDEGGINFTPKYIGLFETFYEVNRQVLPNSEKKVKLDIGDEFDKLYYNYFRGDSEVIHGDSGPTALAYEVFEPNENEIFIEVECGSRFVWKSLKVGTYEFGTKKVELFTITTANLNSKGAEDPKPGSEPKPSVDDSDEAKAKAAKEDAGHNNLIKLIQITIRNNYHHHLIYSSKQNRWELIKKPEFEELYLKYDLKKLVSDTIKAKERDSTKTSEVANQLTNLDDNYVVDISKQNGLFSYSKRIISNFYILTLTLKGSEAQDPASQESMVDVAERSRIFHIYYKDDFICYLFGTKFSISLIKNRSSLFIEVTNVTSASDINNETKLGSKPKPGASSCGEPSGPNSAETTDSESETPKSAASNDTDFSFVDFNDDIIFSNYYFRRGGPCDDKLVRVDQRNFDAGLKSKRFYGADLKLCHYSYYGSSYVASSLTNLPVELRLKLNPNLNPADFAAEKCATKPLGADTLGADVINVSEPNELANDDDSDYESSLCAENKAGFPTNTFLLSTGLEVVMTSDSEDDTDSFSMVSTGALIVTSLLLQAIM